MTTPWGDSDAHDAANANAAWQAAGQPRTPTGNGTDRLGRLLTASAAMTGLGFLFSIIGAVRLSSETYGAFEAAFWPPLLAASGTLVALGIATALIAMATTD